MEMIDDQSLLDGMQIANTNLDNIKRGVRAYLENKQNFFPRFYFLSNTELLQILSETKNPLRVQAYLTKCFEGVHRLEFDDDLNVNAMNSACGERVNFVHKISTTNARGCVEKWLLSVEKEMFEAIRNETNHSYSDYITTDRCHWITNWPQMVVLCISQIFWASDVHCALQNHDKMAINSLCNSIQLNIEEATACVLSIDTTNLDRLTLRSLIIADVNAKDVLLTLMHKSELNDDDFEWVAQLKYYWMNDRILVQILNTPIQFANEYLGNSDRLVTFSMFQVH